MKYGNWGALQRDTGLSVLSRVSNRPLNSPGRAPPLRNVCYISRCCCRGPVCRQCQLVSAHSLVELAAGIIKLQTGFRPGVPLQGETVRSSACQQLIRATLTPAATLSKQHIHTPPDTPQTIQTAAKHHYNLSGHRSVPQACTTIWLVGPQCPPGVVPPGRDREERAGQTEDAVRGQEQNLRTPSVAFPAAEKREIGRAGDSNPEEQRRRWSGIPPQTALAKKLRLWTDMQY
ncbi:hypothetical protein Q5P01_016984 [Channa striata]|uniref:Uncharacterized protein n=1 Tax=Channa striata TaxID=64152 RepID=A0AA88M966_CHASR|nr:hypothetical protein Q5P01_016984 [Channa striata]